MSPGFEVDGPARASKLSRCPQQGQFFSLNRPSGASARAASSPSTAAAATCGSCRTRAPAWLMMAAAFCCPSTRYRRCPRSCDSGAANNKVRFSRAQGSRLHVLLAKPNGDATLRCKTVKHTQVGCLLWR